MHRPLSLKPSPWTPILFRFVGLVLLAAGLSLLSPPAVESSFPAHSGCQRENRPTGGLRSNFSETVALTTSALQWAAQDWELYLARAIAEVELKQTKNAEDDFRRGRFLEPTAYEVPLAEGNAWLPDVLFWP